MGRRTYDSLGRGLPNRKNIVVTHGFGFFASTPDCRAVGSIVEALVLADSWCTKKEHVFVVGGASMYEQFSPFVDRYLITEVAKAAPDADTFFDRSLIEPPDEWMFKSLHEGAPNDDGDEAAFSIFELSARNPANQQARRVEAIVGFNRKKVGNSLAAEWHSRAVA